MIKSLKLAAACLVLASPLAAADACDPGELKIVFAHDAPERGHPKGEAASFLAALVNSDLDGRACMEVLAEAEGYSDDTVQDGFARGDYQFAAPALGNLGHVSRRYLIFDLPFLFKDLDAVFAYHENSSGQQLLSEGVDQGLLGLAYWADGMKEISATRRIRRPEDLAGLSFGIDRSEIEQNYFDNLGAAPTQMPVTALAEALTTGQVEGQNRTLTDVASRSLHLSQQSITESNHGIVQYMLMTSPEFWASLDEQLRLDLELLIAIVTQERNRFALEMRQLAMINVVQDGVPVIRLTDEERYAWVRAMQPTWFEFGGDIGFDQISAALHIERELARGNGVTFSEQ